MSFILDKIQELLKNKKGLAITAGVLLFSAATKLYFRGGMCKADRDLKGQVIVVTGGSAGIGKETIKALSKKGCTIIFGARDKTKSEQVMKTILAQNKDCRLLYFPLDLADKQSIEQFSQKVKQNCQKIDILINNAGISSQIRRETKDGFQANMGVNHLGHFYLTYLLWNLLKLSVHPRIINVSSLAHIGVGSGKNSVVIDFDNFHLTRQFTGRTGYSRSKLANVLFTKQLQRKMDNAGIEGSTFSLHPGVILTDIFADLGVKMKIFKVLFWPIALLCFKTPYEGAQTTLHLVLEDRQKLIPGEYYKDCQVSESSAFSKDIANLQRLWRVSEQQLGIKFDV